MKAHHIGTQAADENQKYAAVIDARMRSRAAESHYSQAQKIIADRIQMAAEMCYDCDAVYINYRQKFIAIKVNNVRKVVDKVNLRLLEQDWAAKGYTKKESAQGVIYTVPRV